MITFIVCLIVLVLGYVFCGSLMDTSSQCVRQKVAGCSTRKI